MILERFSLLGKVALVTGASVGLGKGMAVGLAEAGADIVAAGIGDMSQVQLEVEALGRKFLGINVNLMLTEPIEELVQSAKKAFGRIDILVNNAGITRDKPLAMMSEDDWDSVLDINLKGAFLCTKAAGKVMIKQRSGKIINVASVSGVMGNPGQANYSSSKAGLIGLTKSTAKEL